MPAPLDLLLLASSACDCRGCVKARHLKVSGSELRRERGETCLLVGPVAAEDEEEEEEEEEEVGVWKIMWKLQA